MRQHQSRLGQAGETGLTSTKDSSLGGLSTKNEDKAQEPCNLRPSLASWESGMVDHDDNTVLEQLYEEKEKRKSELSERINEFERLNQELRKTEVKLEVILTLKINIRCILMVLIYIFTIFQSFFNYSWNVST